MAHLLIGILFRLNSCFDIIIAFLVSLIYIRKFFHNTWGTDTVEGELLHSWGGGAVGLLDVVESAIDGTLGINTKILFIDNILLDSSYEVLIVVYDCFFFLITKFLDVSIKLLKSINVVLYGFLELGFPKSLKWHNGSLVSFQELSWSVHNVFVDDLLNNVFEITV